MTVGQRTAQIAELLAPVSDAPRFEAELLTAKVLGLDFVGPSEKAELFPGKYSEALDGLVRRRLSREPLQYILGEWRFMGLPFKVRPCALIPRQDTETLCEAALESIGLRGYRSVLDICTGTGCIAVSLKKLGGPERVCASDISPECAELARENALLNGVDIDIRVCDLFAGHGRFDMITANPPYISKSDMESLQPEVAREPALALYGGEDGLSFYRRIAADGMEHLLPGGVMLLEVGAGEARAVAELFCGRRVEIKKDICGIERVVIVYESN